MDLTLKELLERHTLILAEAAIAERLRRMDGVTLHLTLFNSPLIYDRHAGKLMGSLYGEYIGIARSAGVPILLAAPTWRLDRERISDAGVPGTINQDAVAYMLRLREEAGYEQAVVGALLGAPRTIATTHRRHWRLTKRKHSTVGRQMNWQAPGLNISSPRQSLP